MNVGTDESFLKLKFSQEIVKMWLANKTNAGKFSQEITNNGAKCGWLKQMRAADEKHDCNKYVVAIIITTQ